jgi:hypothetical protein
VKHGVGALLVLLFVLAEAFSLAHSYDSTAHANGQVCAVCVGAASLGAAAVGAPSPVAPVRAAPALLAIVLVVLLSAVPARRYARGPPTGSFTF